MPATTWYDPAGSSKRPSSKAAGESKPEAYPLGYVEDFDELRTLLADFFSSLPRLDESVWQGGHMHLELAPRHIVNITTQCVLDYGERNLIPGNCRE